MAAPDAALIRAEVHVFVGAEPVAIYSIQPGVYLVGQDDSCHLHIAADRVAGMHARLTLHGHRLLVEDLEDTGGIFIGGLRVRLPTPVYQNTEIHIGSARIFFKFDAETRARIAREVEDPSLGLEGIRKELLQEPHQLTGTLGQGGMGLVLSARDLRIHRSVAMKVLRPGNEFAADKLLRFVSEAQLTSSTRRESASTPVPSATFLVSRLLDGLGLCVVEILGEFANQPSTDKALQCP